MPAEAVQVLKPEEKFPSEIKELKKVDPSGNFKYLKWSIKQLEKGTSVNDIIPSIDYFHKNTQKFKKKRIEQYKTLKELEDIVKEISAQRSNRELKKDLKKGAEKLYEDDRYLLVRPDTKEAVMFYGRDTRWCITMKDSDYYEQYIRDNYVFYFLIDKKPKLPRRKKNNKWQLPREDELKNNSKFAFAVNRSDDDDDDDRVQIYNAADHYIHPANKVISRKILPKVNALIKENTPLAPKHILNKLTNCEASIEELDNYLSEFLDFNELRKNVKHISQLLEDNNAAYTKYNNIMVKYLNYLFKINPSDKTHTTDQAYTLIVRNIFASADLLEKISNYYYNNVENKDINKFYKSESILKSVASHRNVSVKTLKKLLRLKNDNIARAIANKAGDIDIEIMYILSKYKDYYVRKNLANRVNIQQEIIRILAKDDKSIVRAEIARREDTPSEILEELYNSTKDDLKNFNSVLLSLAENENTPVHILHKLSKIYNTGIQIRTARNNSSTVDILTDLSKHEDLYVRVAVAENPLTPIDILNKFVDEEEIISKTSYHFRNSIFYSLSRNKSLSVEILEKLAKNKFYRVRLAIINHPSITPKILTFLSKDRSIKVKREVAAHPLTPPENLRKLSESGDSEIKRNLASNSSTPKDILDSFFDIDDYYHHDLIQNSSTSKKTLWKLYHDYKNDAYYKEDLAKNPSAPLTILRRFAKSADPDILNSLDKNPTYIAKIKK